MKRINILGDLNADVILSGMKTPPALGKEIIAEKYVMHAGGSAANTALMLASMDCPVKFFSRIGNDIPGDKILEQLAHCGLETDGILQSDSEKTGVTVSLTYPDDRMYITYPGTVASVKPADFPEGYLSAGDHLHLSSYFLQKALRPLVGELLKKAKSRNMTTSLDPGGDPEQQWDMKCLEPYWRYLDWFLPNRDEIKGICGAGSLKAAVRGFSSRVPGVLVKMGKDGAMLRCQGKIESFPGNNIDIVDTTGAGDCFNAGFLYALLKGGSRRELVLAGIECGEKAVSSHGLPIRKLTQ